MTPYHKLERFRAFKVKYTHNGYGPVIRIKDRWNSYTRNIPYDHSLPPEAIKQAHIYLEERCGISIIGESSDDGGKTYNILLSTDFHTQIK